MYCYAMLDIFAMLLPKNALRRVSYFHIINLSFCHDHIHIFQQLCYLQVFSFIFINISHYRQMYQTNAPVPILIMENMISLGYSTIHDRREISFDSTKVLIGKLAQFHATSFVLDKQIDTVSNLNDVYFDHHMDKSYCDDMNKCIDKMKQLDGFEYIVQKLEGTTEEMFESVRNLYYNPDEAECKVLCHGDMKFENTLLKKGENVVENGVFVRIDNLKENTT